jgi:hypothetical protein
VLSSSLPTYKIVHHHGEEISANTTQLNTKPPSQNRDIIRNHSPSQRRNSEGKETSGVKAPSKGGNSQQPNHQCNQQQQHNPPRKLLIPICGQSDAMWSKPQSKKYPGAINPSKGLRVKQMKINTTKWE